MNHEDTLKMMHKQDSAISNDTDSNPGSIYSEPPQLSFYPPDENPPDTDQIDSQRISRRQFLPSEELEKLRRRERDAKRKQRERHRIANGSSPSVSSFENFFLQSNVRVLVDVFIFPFRALSK